MMTPTFLKVWQITVVFSVVSGIITSASRISSCPEDKKKPWSYDDNFPNGPANWYKTYPNCKGNNQSPVNIVTSQVNNGNGRQRLTLENYNSSVTSAKIENLGYRVEVTPEDDVKRSITVNGTSYFLTHLHFHWGNETAKGSEQEINGNKYTMETHLMHKNKDGHVIGVAYFLSKSNQNNPAIGSLLFTYPSILYEGNSYQGLLPQAMDLTYLVQDGCNYYRYEGAMGFPPCDPGVTWLVCRSDGQISNSQLEQLFSLYRVKKGSPEIELCHLVNNGRPVQPLNGRIVYG